MALGPYLSGTLGLVRSIAFGLMAGLMMGVLKGTTLYLVVAAAGLSIAFVPLGFRELRDGPMPNFKAAESWILGLTLLPGLLYFFGQSG